MIAHDSIPLLEPYASDIQAEFCETAGLCDLEVADKQLGKAHAEQPT
jgi:hypothetical protein